MPGILFRTVGVVIREDCHKGGGEGAFSKKIPEKVGNPKGDDEGVVGGSSSKHTGEYLFADKPQYPAEHHCNTDGSRRPCNFPAFLCCSFHSVCLLGMDMGKKLRVREYLFF